ncbi:cupin domain-containing protein [Streptomyces sp. NPDC049881]|uniref:JmjC domain-containing protein n=1 Tax=unclassified Streptomyces TaxID=2593676 RepID=UPI00342AFA7D
MSLDLFLPEAGVTDLLTTWPDEPHVYDRGKTPLDQHLTAASLREYVSTGCIPAEEIAAIKAPNPSISQNAFKTNGRTDADKLRTLHDNGFTLRLGNLQRVVPFLAQASRGIQEQTGYSNYIHAFMTPCGGQGLRHHWDQQMAVIVQLQGQKRWQLWRPPVEAPMREYNESFRVWKDDYVERWTAAGPDLDIDLGAGQCMLLPRGWVHNPSVREGAEASVHLTVAIRERTPMWLAEKLTASAIEDPAFRRLLLPNVLLGEELATVSDEVRHMLIAHLQAIDAPAMARLLRAAALKELEYTT